MRLLSVRRAVLGQAVEVAAMGRVEFTKEQQAAVYGVGNTIVSAGAGSGKTAVMIERITEKLKAGKSLDNMLILTVTRAAAGDSTVKLDELL